jgi:hypothetical protein
MAELSNIIPYTLRAIYIRSSQIEMAKWFDPTSFHMIDGEFRVLDGNVECRKQDIPGVDGQSSTQKLCLFTTRFEFRYTIHDETKKDTKDGQVEVAKISADVAADYLFTGDEFPVDEELHKWGQSNVLLHTWPYWREFCHNSLCRMQLPVTLMPLLNMTLPTEQSAPEQKAIKAGKLRKK